jgi:hypothetical protein
MSKRSEQVMELFNQKLEDPGSWKKLEEYCASYIRDAIKEGRKYNGMHHPDECSRLLVERLPRKDYPSLHVLLSLWAPEIAREIAERDFLESFKDK